MLLRNELLRNVDIRIFTPYNLKESKVPSSAHSSTAITIYTQLVMIGLKTGEVWLSVPLSSQIRD